MTNPMQSPATVSNIGVAMFTIADQDAAIAYYTQTLGWEPRADVPFGDEGGNRWVEVAPPGSTARLALNPPMGEWTPGGSAIGVESPDVNAEYARVTAIGRDHYRADGRRGTGSPHVLDRRSGRQPHLGRSGSRLARRLRPGPGASRGRGSPARRVARPPAVGPP